MKAIPYLGLLCVTALTWSGVSSGAPVSGASHVDNLKSFATDGSRILESQVGDLNGDGHPDALLVLDPPTPTDAKLGEGPFREVVLLLRDASGQLRKVASNAHIVPCAQCGGVAGDPFGYSRIEPGRFTLVDGGGSREHWSDEYRFTYDQGKKDWFVTQVTRHVEDNETGKQKTIELNAKDLGPIRFQDFDPSHLPEVALP